MQDNVSVIVATLLAVIIIVLFPIYNVATRNDSMANNIVIKATTSFVDEVRNKGYITSSDYVEFLTALNKTGNVYEVELEVYKPFLVKNENTIEEYEEKYVIDYTEDILAKIGQRNFKNTSENVTSLEVASNKSILTEEAYYLNFDYKFYVRVKNTNITQAQILLDRLFGGEIKNRIVVNYGGIVYANNWEKGEDAVMVSSNISISRPMYLEDGQYKEYKYDYITSVYEGETEKKVYGIAVRLNDSAATSGRLHFLLTYKDISQFTDGSGNVLTTSEQRANHIKGYVKSIGFDIGSVNVEEVEGSWIMGSNGFYSGKYIITLDNITYDYDNNPYKQGRVQIDSGSAQSIGGDLGQLKSEEFVLFYNINEPVLQNLYVSNPSYAVTNGGIYLTSTDSATLTFTADAIIDSSVSTIKEIVFEINNGHETKTITKTAATMGTSFSASITEAFYIGNYTVKAWALDNRGHESEKQTFEFKVDDHKPIIQDLYVSNPLNAVTNGGTYNASTYPYSFTFTADAYINSSVVTIKEIVFKINNGQKERTETIAVSGTATSSMQASITETFYAGKCYVKAWAIDSKGRSSEIATFEFMVNLPDPQVHLTHEYIDTNNISINITCGGHSEYCDDGGMYGDVELNKYTAFVGRDDNGNLTGLYEVYAKIINIFYVDFSVDFGYLTSGTLNFKLTSGNSIVGQQALQYSSIVNGGSYRSEYTNGQFVEYTSNGNSGVFRLGVQPGKSYTFEVWAEDSNRGVISEKFTYTFKVKYAFIEEENLLMQRDGNLEICMLQGAFLSDLRVEGLSQFTFGVDKTTMIAKYNWAWYHYHSGNSKGKIVTLQDVISDIKRGSYNQYLGSNWKIRGGHIWFAGTDPYTWYVGGYGYIEYEFYDN